MQIHLVTGKGGVGKSAVAAAWAWNLSERGQKTLLVELGDESFYKDYLDLPEVSYKPHSFEGHFDVSLWSGPAALREYALYLLKIERLYKLFFENPVTKTLIDVAPALSELAVLGKITSGPPRNVGPKLPYDSLVIDCFSSGHFVALLKAPIGMAESVRFGPMHEQSLSILKVLRDPKITRVHIVSLPEELPVQEAIELDQELQRLLGYGAHLWLNKWVRYPAGMSESGPAFEKEFIRKNQRQEEAWRILSKGFAGRIHKLPFVFETGEKEILAALKEEIREK